MSYKVTIFLSRSGTLTVDMSQEDLDLLEKWYESRDGILHISHVKGVGKVTLARDVRHLSLQLRR